MVSLKRILLGGLAMVAGAASIPARTTSTNTTSPIPRGYSVPPAGHDGIVPWPKRPTDPDTGDYRPIWYCYADEESHSLEAIVVPAIAKWLPACRPNSALVIEKHPDCTGSCLCKDLPQPSDALVIQDMGPGYASRTSIGYDTTSSNTNRHYLLFGRSWSTDKDILTMAHELGHAMGLLHEHQRPDRDAWVEYRCYNAAGYEDVEATVEDSDDPMFAGKDDINDRMDIVCNELQGSLAFFPETQNWMEGDQLWDGYMTDGLAWDQNSIMNYGSFYGAEDNSGLLEDAVIVAKTSDGEGQEIFQGGNADYAQAGPSANDIARVKFLYPLNLNGFNGCC